eukprot:gene782-834_t
MITDEVITKESGQYDKEIIQHLRLEKYGISKISNLDTCISLVELNLARNEIAVIAGLDNLINLKRLDLSFNRITKLENISNLQSLHSLDIRANCIGNIADLNCLSKLPEFIALHLRGVDGEDANPVCKHESYNSIALTLLPQLEVLDGGHVKIAEAFQIVEDQLEKVQPDPIPTPPPEPWLTSKDLQIGSGLEDINTVINNERTFAPLLELESKLNSMLTEDCSHLLRKAQTAISKAMTKP